ncbi:MAG TPA: M23 family metallopeptidase [Candidatus Merdivicinus intestinigallinarum]|nr:M23 family metallopeptidase [Candidatus Merdivicinus intestinigallinarum]
MKWCLRILTVLTAFFVWSIPGTCAAVDFEPMPPPDGADFSPYQMTAALSLPLNLKDAAVTSHFGWRFHPMTEELDFHTGADLSCPEGTPVHALLGGTVLAAEFHESYGNYVLLDHGSGFQTLYAHCQKLKVKEGQRVSAGQTIALSGQTGEATGPHLHLEVKENGVRLNPAWLPFWEQYEEAP